MKKFSGILFFVFAALVIMGLFSNVSLSDISLSFERNPAGVAGLLFGIFISVAIFIGAGIFFFALDANCKAYFSEKSYKQRGSLCVWSIVFAAYFFLLFLDAAYSFGARTTTLLSFLLSLVFCLIMGIPAIYYSASYFSAKKALKGTSVNEILACGEFTPIKQGSSIYANQKAVLFMKLFCVIPFDKIAGVSEKNDLLEKSIVIKLTDGKKVTVSSKEYETLSAFIGTRQSGNYGVL